MNDTPNPFPGRPPVARRPAAVLLPLLAAGLALGLAACGSSSGVGGDGGAAAGTLKYDATVRRTTYGIPHIKADDFGSMGYGYGYAFAEDNLCLLMEDIVTVRGERARYFGRNGAPYVLQATGVSAPNVDSDFFWRHVATSARLTALRDKSSPDARTATTGFKDGFNRYMAELKSGQHPGRHATCAGAEWLQPLSDDDMYRRYYRLSVLASNSVFLPGVATAQPPVGGASGASSGSSTAARSASATADPAPLASLTPEQRAELQKHYPFGGELNIGSNMYAIGPDGTRDGQSIQFINPHFPWKGTERLYMAHLTIPGRADIMGVGLYGVPAVLIGFNNHLAWSHTVSSAYRFTFYELTLAPNDPTSYIYAGAVTKMVPHPMTIEVKEDNGTITKATRTLYDSRFGPMLTFSVAVPGAGATNIFPWSTAKAYTLRDANAENTRLIDQFLGWNQARNLSEFKALHASINGVPWVNTTATGPGETAYYGDLSVVPNVPDSLVTNCSTSAQAQALAQLAPGLPLLDGSMAACEWRTDADAAAPGVFGPTNQPKLERRDYVSNFNDSYWLTNAAQPITGFARIFGLTGTTRSLRTRLGLLKMTRRLDGTDNKGAAKWTPELLKESVLDSYIYSAELARDAVVANLCTPATGLTSSGATVDVTKACAALRTWDMTNNLDSRGGHVWREFWRRAQGAQGFYTTPFSAADPVNTPRGVNTASPQVRQAFYDAVALFNGLGIEADAPFGTISHATFDPSIPVFGSVGNLEGGFTIATGALSRTGYDVTFGNSIVGVVTWDKATGRVVPDAFLTYSQSTDPANPHFSDFTRAYSRKEWKRLPFAEDEIAAQQEGAAVRLTE